MDVVKSLGSPLKDGASIVKGATSDEPEEMPEMNQGSSFWNLIRIERYINRFISVVTTTYSLITCVIIMLDAWHLSYMRYSLLSWFLHELALAVLVVIRIRAEFKRDANMFAIVLILQAVFDFALIGQTYAVPAAYELFNHSPTLSTLQKQVSVGINVMVWLWWSGIVPLFLFMLIGIGASILAGECPALIAYTCVPFGYAYLMGVLGAAVAQFYLVISFTGPTDIFTAEHAQLLVLIVGGWYGMTLYPTFLGCICDMVREKDSSSCIGCCIHFTCCLMFLPACIASKIVPFFLLKPKFIKFLFLGGLFVTFVLGLCVAAAFEITDSPINFFQVRAGLTATLLASEGANVISIVISVLRKLSTIVRPVIKAIQKKLASKFVTAILTHIILSFFKLFVISLMERQGIHYDEDRLYRLYSARRRKGKRTKAVSAITGLHLYIVDGDITPGAPLAAAVEAEEALSTPKQSVSVSNIPLSSKAGPASPSAVTSDYIRLSDGNEGPRDLERGVVVATGLSSGPSAPRATPAPTTAAGGIEAGRESVAHRVDSIGNPSVYAEYFNMYYESMYDSEYLFEILM